MSLPFFAYILRCADGSYYVGQTDNLELRQQQHAAGTADSYTGRRLPVALVWYQEFTTREEAKAAEARLKGWSRAKKEALIAGRTELLPRLASRGADGVSLRASLKRSG